MEGTLRDDTQLLGKGKRRNRGLGLNHTGTVVEAFSGNCLASLCIVLRGVG